MTSPGLQIPGPINGWFLPRLSNWWDFTRASFSNGPFSHHLNIWNDFHPIVWDHICLEIHWPGSVSWVSTSPHLSRPTLEQRRDSPKHELLIHEWFPHLPLTIFYQNQKFSITITPIKSKQPGWEWKYKSVLCTNCTTVLWILTIWGINSSAGFSQPSTSMPEGNMIWAMSLKAAPAYRH